MLYFCVQFFINSHDDDTVSTSYNVAYGIYNICDVIHTNHPMIYYNCRDDYKTYYNHESLDEPPFYAEYNASLYVCI